MVERITFNGIIFRRYPDSERLEDQRYYKPSAKFRKAGVEALHREIWKAHHGTIPVGHCIHHIDRDTGNNDISNLQCMPLGEHHKEHPSPGCPHGMAKAQVAAVVWHKSKAGRAWHSGHAKQSIKKRTWVIDCKHCGKRVEFRGRIQRPKFCSNNCKSAWRRGAGLDDIAKVCVACGETFVANRYARAKCCSRECGARASAIRRVDKPTKRRAGVQSDSGA